MSFSCFLKLAAAALAAALVGWGALHLVGSTAQQPACLFAAGLFFGTLFGGLLVALYPKPEAAKDGSDAHSESASGEASGNIYVGNLPFNAGEDDIKNIFSPYGTVIEIRMVKDRRSKRFKGYAFVEMDAAGAAAAIAHLDSTDYAGRTLRVNEAKKRGDN